MTVDKWLFPKKARDLFGINNGDSLVVLGDEAEGIALIKADEFEKRLNNTWNNMKQEINSDQLRYEVAPFDIMVDFIKRLC